MITGHIKKHILFNVGRNKQATASRNKDPTQKIQVIFVLSAVKDVIQHSQDQFYLLCFVLRLLPDENEPRTCNYTSCSIFMILLVTVISKILSLRKQSLDFTTSCALGYQRLLKTPPLLFRQAPN